MSRYITFVLIGFSFLSVSVKCQNFEELNGNLNGIAYQSIPFKTTISDTIINYSIYLPKNYHTSPDSFPVLFLLHGLRGDETSWMKSLRIHKIVDSLIEIDEINPFIIVLPEGKNSYYINDINCFFPFDSIFIYDLYPFIYSHYKILNNKKNCFIGGLSMGGFGAIHLAIKHPDYFGGVIGLSAAIRTDSMMVKENDIKYNTYFAPLFGEEFIGCKRLNQHWMNNNILTEITDSIVKELNQISWYLDCGQFDYFLEGNEVLHQLFVQYKIPHEYHIEPGNHERKYWEDGMIEWLNFINSKILDNKNNARIVTNIELPWRKGM